MKMRSRQRGEDEGRAKKYKQIQVPRLPWTQRSMSTLQTARQMVLRFAEAKEQSV